MKHGKKIIIIIQLLKKVYGNYQLMLFKNYQIIEDNLNIDYMIMKIEIFLNSYLKYILQNKENYSLKKDKKLC